MDEEAVQPAPQVADTITEAAKHVSSNPTWQAFVYEIFNPETLAGKAASVLVIVLIAAAAYWMVLWMLGRTRRRLYHTAETLTGLHERRMLRAATVLSIVGSGVKWVIALVALIWIMSALGTDVVPLLAGVGFLGAAIAFGSQTLVKDLVSGLFLLLEGQYAEGDYVNLGGKFGRVEEIRFRTTVLRDLDNQFHHIPNGSITAVTVYEEPYINYVLEIPLADAAEAERLRVGLDDLSAEMREKYPLHITEMGPAVVDQSRDYPNLVRLPVAVFPTQDWIATEELATRAQIMLDEMDIAVAEKLKMRVYADISEVSVHIEETKASVSGTEVIPRR